jgi:hypothetical protein
VPALPSDEPPDSLRGRARRTGLRLLIWLVVILLLVVPLLEDFPLGDTSRAGVIAWILVGVALYWLFTDMGYRPLLLFQLFFFSAAVALLTAKVFLVAIGVYRGPILRRVAIWFILFGAVCAGLNVAISFLDNIRRRSSRIPPP